MDFGVSLRQFALADSGNAAEEHFSLFRQHGVEGVQFRVASAEMAAGIGQSLVDNVAAQDGRQVRGRQGGLSDVASEKLYSQAFEQCVEVRNLKHSKGGGS